MTTTRALLLFIILGLGLALGARAEARAVRFVGPHPIAARHGHGYCYIEAPHLHDYAPDHTALYQQVGDAYVFTGDPTPFGYDGERHKWAGHHRVVVEGASEPVFCLIDGPHFHAYAPPPGPEFEVHDDVAVYVAPIPSLYVTPHRVRLVNAEYRPFAGAVVEGPRVSVEVSAPGIVFGAPPPVIIAPPPVVVGPPMFVGAPGPVFVSGPRYEHEGRWERHDRGEHEEHEHEHEHGERGEWHHDNGRHNGWRK